MTNTNSRFTPEEKRQIVLALLSKSRTPAEICRDHQVSSTTLYKWRDAFLEAGLAGLRGKGPTQREQDQAREIAKLKQLVGELTLANYALKGGLSPSMGNKGGRVS